MTLDLFDLVVARGGEISVVSERPAEAGRIVLIEEQLELFLAAYDIGGLRQRRQRLALGLERFLLAHPFTAQCGSAPLCNCLRRAQVLDLPALRRNHQFRITQACAQGVALFELVAQTAGERGNPCAYRSELGLGLRRVGGLGRGGPRRTAKQGTRHEGDA